MEEGARVAGPGDAAELERLAAAARRGLADQRGGSWWTVLGTPHRWSPGLAGALFADPALRVLVGTIDEVPVGYAVGRLLDVEETGARLLVVDELYVEPEAREVGVGEALMDRLLEVAAEEGCVGVDAMALPGDRATKNFFERFGLVARAIVVHRRLDPGS